MQIAECFKILNVSPGEDWRRVRKSYHSLAKQFHPDINQYNTDIPTGDTRLKEINQAFEKLETHYKASNNFQQLEPYKQKRNPAKLRNLFNRLQENPAVQRTINSTVNFLVDLDSKVFQLDIQKDIKIPESSIQKGASLHLKSGKDRFEVKIPSGDWNEMSLKVPGKGESSLFSKRRGDLVLNLRAPAQKITSAARFSYDMKLPRQRMDGGKVMTLNSSEGPIKFILPRNTREGQSFTLRSLSGTQHVVTVRLT
jgi:DnaJ-class molecular chaperone